MKSDLPKGTPPGQGSNVVDSLRGSFILPTTSLMTPSKSFGEVFDHTVGGNQNDRARQDDRSAKDTDTQDQDGRNHDDRSEKTFEEDGQLNHERFSSSRQRRQRSSRKAKGQGAQAVQAFQKERVEATKQGQGIQTGGIDQNLTQGVQGFSQLNAEKLLQQMEQIQSFDRGQNLPPQVLNYIVSQISSHFYDAAKREILVRFQESVLGGQLNVRLRQDGEGGVSILFDGEEEVLAKLKQHEQELSEALSNSGQKTRVKFA